MYYVQSINFSMKGVQWMNLYFMWLGHCSNHKEIITILYKDLVIGEEQKCYYTEDYQKARRDMIMEFSANKPFIQRNIGLNYILHSILSVSVLTWLLVMSSTVRQPARAMVCSNSFLSISITCFTPVSPLAARPQMTGRPICRV